MSNGSRLANLSVFYESVEHDDVTFLRFGNKVCFGNEKSMRGEFKGFFLIKQIKKKP